MYIRRLAKGVKHTLQDLYEALNISDAQNVVSQLMYAKQTMFEYRDKPGKCLVHL